ncbi:galectin-10-like [Myotis daubentonii]|uniref:galectin-10-like n=1 Tax=Myotis daubentonii TaxID=98922 RepID=UPI002873395E|nr:galectin-10-like [Myotis daubentonii]
METLPVPYKKDVFFTDDSSVTIKGKPVLPFSMFPEMQVDFFTGTEVDSDIAFHFRVYFGKEVVMNSRHGGTWGEEVKSTDMPFKDGQPFQVGISVLSDQYRVTVNGTPSHTFPHRLDPKTVKMILVWRDVSLTSVVPK